LWRFEGKRYWTTFFADPAEALSDAVIQINDQLAGTWQDKAGPKTLVEDWIDDWRDLLPDDLAKKTCIKYRYFIEDFILPQFEGRELGSLTFTEIEKWEKAIRKRISARGTPYAPSVASGARSLLITILGDAVHAGKIKTNPAERRRGRRGKVKAKGRRGPSKAARQAPKNNVLTSLQAICLAERCALMSGRDIDFVMNVFAAWMGTRWGELMAVEGSEDKDSPLQLPDSGIGTYALDWQLLDVGGEVSKAPPKDGSYRVLDIPPFLADLLRWAVKNRLPSCCCPLLDDGRPACKGDNPDDEDHYDPTPASYLFLGPRGGHPRRSNYADDILTPAAEGLHPQRNGSRRPVYIKAESWPGIPIRKGNRKHKAADLADGTWPNLTGHVKPHDYRHTHATVLENSDVKKVLAMDRRGHAMAGMDAVYVHVTDDMRQHLCDVLEELWRNGIAERYEITPRSAVPILDEILLAHAQASSA
jgi:integrase